MTKRKNNKDFTSVNFHRFLQLEKSATHLEIAEDLGISIREVNALKKKVNRA